MNRTSTMLLLLAALGLCLPLGLGHLRGEAAEAPVAEAEQRPADRQAAEGDGAIERSAEDVLDELLRRRAENPLIEPSDAGRDGSPAAPEGRDAAQGRLRPGAAADSAPLRREGQFLVTRRARMIAAPAAGAVGEARPARAGAARAVQGAAAPTGWMIAFESDGEGHDPPMHLMPCRLLEEMERIHQEHGESVVFLISGKVFVYRGANYLLPTLAQVAPDRGNLQP